MVDLVTQFSRAFYAQAVNGSTRLHRTAYKLFPRIATRFSSSPAGGRDCQGWLEDEGVRALQLSLLHVP